MASLAAARYVPSDPKTCYKEQLNKKRNLEQSEAKYDLSPRSPMGGSIARRFTGRRQPCLDCCEASALFCHSACRARFSGAGDAFWLLAACQSGCSAWETGCIAACYNFPV
ncbi:hypothetical protein E4U47_001041 [Claviceps purpurea]|nr:hypothetical protein E4U12_000852 [Claviceps purpurea]KAG6145733.1 hypothetical protein E4U28_001416 [Claviceps purpurea]KAG6149238.1 hypothetical protein E4U37_006933 [Claviceps purpurea]KAG6167491.1 hypothetical protein E4U51_002857 [Claviceps purpurea]KAG6180379.1 hypothetical protein E4U27_002813 [Claviceps purpurea]